MGDKTARAKHVPALLAIDHQDSLTPRRDVRDTEPRQTSALCRQPRHPTPQQAWDDCDSAKDI